MLFQNRVETFYNDGSGDCNYYAITNSDKPICLSEGDINLPGLNVHIPDLTPEIWKNRCWPCITSVDPIGDGANFENEVIGQILFGLFRPDDNERDIGWKITSIELLGATMLRIMLHSEQLYRMRKYLGIRELCEAESSKSRPDFTSMIPTDQYVAYWQITDNPRKASTIVVEPSKVDARRYKLHLCGHIRIEESGERFKRELEFSDEEKDGVYASSVKVHICEAFL